MGSDDLVGACAELEAQGLSHYEIARRLKRRRSTVQSALRRAREREVSTCAEASSCESGWEQLELEGFGNKGVYPNH
jgi:IS30 family transposase